MCPAMCKNDSWHCFVDCFFVCRIQKWLFFLGGLIYQQQLGVTSTETETNWGVKWLLTINPLKTLLPKHCLRSITVKVGAKGGSIKLILLLVTKEWYKKETLVQGMATCNKSVWGYSRVCMCRTAMSTLQPGTAVIGSCLQPAGTQIACSAGRVCCRRDELSNRRTAVGSASL